MSLWLRPDGTGSLNYLWLGDTVTLTAIAGTKPQMPCYHPLYSAIDQPARFESDSLTVNVGDTVSVRVDALDRDGTVVQNGQVVFNIGNPRDSVLAFVAQPRGEAPFFTVSTPMILRLRTLRPGDGTLIVAAPHELPKSELPPRPTASIVVHVVAKAGVDHGPGTPP